MSNTRQHAFRLTALCAALSAAWGPALADDAAIAALTKPESSVSIGLGNWSNDRPQQGIYDGMRDARLYGLIDFDFVRRDDATGTWTTFRGRNLGLDTREIRGEWYRQGDVGVFVEYSRMPRDNPYKFNTALQGLGTTNLIVAGSGAAALPFRDIELGVRRDVVNLGVTKNLMPGLDLRVAFRNDYKEGERQWGRGGAAEFAYEPIESTTRQVDVALEYATEKLQVAGGYNGSWYENSFGLVNTQLNQGAPTTQYYLSLPLDNQAHQVYLNAGYNFTPTTRATLKVAYTHATQDEHLPTKDVAGLSLATSPTHLDGRLDTTLVQAGLTSRPTADLSLLANLRYHNVDEKTPQARFVQTGTGVCSTTQTCVDNTPLSFKTITGKAEALYRLPMQFNLIGGVEYRSQDRTVPVGSESVTAAGVDRQRYVPFRSDVDEWTYRLQLRRSMSSVLNGSIAYEHKKRDGSAYSLTNEEESDEINPIHIADRKRDKVRATIDWMPIDALSLQLNVEGSRDRYEHTEHRPYGLRNGSAVLYSLDASYAIGDRWQVGAWASYDRTKANQHGQRAQTQTNATPPVVTAAAAEKEANLEDQGASIGVNVTGRPMDRLTVGADLQWTRNKSKYPETVTTTAAGPQYPAGVVGPLPDIENKLTRLKFYGSWALDKNSDIRLDYIHERWETDDWSWLFADRSTFTYGTTTDGTQVITSPKQTSNFVGIRYIYRFR